MADKVGWLDTLERVLRIIREAALLLVLFLVLYHFLPQLPRIAWQIKSAQVDQPKSPA